MLQELGKKFIPDHNDIESAGGSRLAPPERKLTEAQQLAEEIYDMAKDRTTEVRLLTFSN